MSEENNLQADNRHQDLETVFADTIWPLLPGNTDGMPQFIFNAIQYNMPPFISQWLDNTRAMYTIAVDHARCRPDIITDAIDRVDAMMIAYDRCRLIDAFRRDVNAIVIPKWLLNKKVKKNIALKNSYVHSPPAMDIDYARGYRLTSDKSHQTSHVDIATHATVNHESTQTDTQANSLSLQVLDTLNIEGKCEDQVFSNSDIESFLIFSKSHKRPARANRPIEKDKHAIQKSHTSSKQPSVQISAPPSDRLATWQSNASDMAHHTRTGIFDVSENDVKTVPLGSYIKDRISARVNFSDVDVVVSKMIPSADIDKYGFDTINVVDRNTFIASSKDYHAVCPISSREISKLSNNAVVGMYINSFTVSQDDSCISYVVYEDNHGIRKLVVQKSAENRLWKVLNKFEASNEPVLDTVVEHSSRLYFVSGNGLRRIKMSRIIERFKQKSKDNERRVELADLVIDKRDIPDIQCFSMEDKYCYLFNAKCGYFMQIPFDGSNKLQISSRKQIKPNLTSKPSWSKIVIVKTRIVLCTDKCIYLFSASMENLTFYSSQIACITRMTVNQEEFIAIVSYVGINSEKRQLNLLTVDENDITERFKYEISIRCRTISYLSDNRLALISNNAKAIIMTLVTK